MLTVRQVAERLGVTPARVRQLIMEKRLKATALTARFSVIEETDLAEYMRTPPPPIGRPRKHTKQSEPA